MRGLVGRVADTAQIVFFALTARTMAFSAPRQAVQGSSGAGRQPERGMPVVEHPGAAPGGPAGDRGRETGSGAEPAEGTGPKADAKTGGGASGGPLVARSCTPQQIRGGIGHLADSRGELALFFPGCLSLAAPAILFRLKREGFSSSTVEASERGILVRATR